MLHSRIERVQKLLQGEIAQIIDQELKNPLIPHFVTVWGVKVAKDLSTGLVLITFLQDQSEEVIRQTVAELNRSAGYISRLVAQRVRMKRHPKLKFVYNPSTHYALEIERMFQQIKRQEGERGEEDRAGGAGDEIADESQEEGTE